MKINELSPQQQAMIKWIEKFAVIEGTTTNLFIGVGNDGEVTVIGALPKAAIPSV